MERRYIDHVLLQKPIPKEDWLSALPVVRSLEQRPALCFDSDVTFFVGENGTGKSTLLEAIAVAYGFNPEGGTRNFCFSTRETHSALHQYITLGKAAYAQDGFFYRAESFYNVATNIDDMDGYPSFGPLVIENYGGVSLHRQSHGESLMALVQNRFGGNGLYLLDEPEAALSPARILTLLCEIDRLVRQHSQFLIATHSPLLMAYPGARIYVFSDDGITDTPYRQTTHYQITRRFLDDPDALLRQLLGEYANDEP